MGRPKLGGDPGHGHLVELGGYVQGTKRFKGMSLSWRQLRKESMTARHERIMEHEMDRAASATADRPLKEHLEEIFNGTNGKTPDYNEFLKYAAAHFAAAAASVQLRARATWRKFRFKKWQARRSSIMRFSRRIRSTFGDDVVLFLRNKYTRAQSRFMPPAIGIGLYRELRSLGFEIYLTDEYLTSQISFRTGTREFFVFFFFDLASET